MYDLISGVFGSALGGAFGPSPADTGAAAQAASNQKYILRTYFDPATQTERREYWQAGLAVSDEELRLQAMRGAQNAWPGLIAAYNTTPHPMARSVGDRIRRELDRPDWLYWGILAAMALALIVRAWMQYAP